MTEVAFRQPDGTITDEDGLLPFVTASPFGERTWWAKDAEHAREQHADAFEGDDTEFPFTVRAATESDLLGTPGLAIFPSGYTPEAAAYEHADEDGFADDAGAEVYVPDEADYPPEMETTTPAERLAEAVAEFSMGTEDPPELASKRYLLIEQNISHGDPPYWLSLFDTPQQAAEYHDGQEYAEDWLIVRLIDLETGDSLEATTTTTFERKEN